MNKIDQESIDKLLDVSDGLVASIYMPTHRGSTPPHKQEDMIRFKNKVREARERLGQAGMDESIVSKLARRCEQLQKEEAFWSETLEGLALFISKNTFTYFHLPLECDEYVEVGLTPNVTPLLALVSYDQPYNFLVLATHTPVFYEGDMYGLHKVDLAFPSSPEEALHIDEMFSSSHTQRGRAALGGSDVRIGTHGQGDSRQAGSEERLVYFRILDKKIISSGDVNHQLPLLLAGTPDDVTDYRLNSHYPHVIDTYVNGNHTKTQERELHDLAWPIIQRECREKQNHKLVESFQELQGTGRSSSDVDNIREAAKGGRVDALLLDVTVRTRDTVGDTNQVITKLILPKDMADIINSLVIATHLHGGKITALMQQTMPAQTALAAIYRY